MGFEVTRFIHEVDEEFHCSICKLVLQDPTQSPCEHVFCNECITGWLAVDQSCPVERGPLQSSDLKPAMRGFRNLLNKIEIKCDFESKGCAAVVKLENLQVHVGSCEYHPKGEERLSNEAANASNDLFNEQPEFRVCRNLKFYDQPNVLEVEYGFGFAQSAHSLNQTRCSFKIKVLSLGDWIGIGLTPMYPSDLLGCGTAFYGSNEHLFIDGRCVHPGRRWRVGDIIECGINFPSDFVNDGRRVQVYFKKNGELIHEGFVAMHVDGLFPTVSMEKYSKIKF